jgi:uncharacterized protein YnzC (UPF0291/DUF896 family)
MAMKVTIARPKKEKRPRKPKREEYIFRSRRLWETPLGHLAVLDKNKFVAYTHIEFKKYLRRMFRGCFTLLTETKTTWIVKRTKYAPEETQENDSLRRRYYYLPKRASGNNPI